MLKSSKTQQIIRKGGEKNKELGITLIALVITIIVILILAGVSISMMTGNNGILTQTVKAKESTVLGEEKDQVSIAYSAATINNLGEYVTYDDLQKELDKIIPNET